jgi:hypothetical protein
MNHLPVMFIEFFLSVGTVPLFRFSAKHSFITLMLAGFFSAGLAIGLRVILLDIIYGLSTPIIDPRFFLTVTLQICLFAFIGRVFKKKEVKTDIAVSNEELKVVRPSLFTKPRMAHA